MKKNGYVATFYCRNFFKKKSIARHRTVSLKKFYEWKIPNCSGKIIANFLKNGTVEARITPCTNIQHINRKILTGEEKSFIVDKLQSGMSMIQIRHHFIRNFKRNVSRYEINNLKYKNRIFLEYQTNKNDLLSTKNLLFSLSKSNKIYSNIESIQKIEDLVAIVQFNYQQSMIQGNQGVICIDSTHSLSKYKIIIYW